MASYTMELRNYIEMFSQYDDDLTLNERIEIGRQKLFDFDYPLFDPEYKKTFETNIIRKFYMREIGFETEGLFKMQLETWLNIKMIYFNQLFASELIKFDPLINASMLTGREKINELQRDDDRNTDRVGKMSGRGTGKSNQKGSQETTNTDDNFNRNVSSDTPDSRLQITTEDGKGVIEYASDIDEQKGNSKSTSKGSNESQVDSTDTSDVDSSDAITDTTKRQQDEREHYYERRLGKIGVDSQSKLIQDFRGTFLRVEEQIHKEMQELFMLVY